jgi:hypothetical protein
VQYYKRQPKCEFPQGLGEVKLIQRKHTRRKVEGKEEELKCADMNMKKAGGSNNRLITSKNEKEIDQTTEDQLTPRLENPVSMLRRSNSIEPADEIPNERMEPIRLLPLLNVTRVVRINTRRNRSQLVIHNKSGCSFILLSPLSHE